MNLWTQQNFLFYFGDKIYILDKGIFVVAVSA